MSFSKVAILLCFAALLAVPLLFRPEGSRPAAPADAQRLIIITPHNEQIRTEFSAAFEQWHQREFGEPVQVIWSVPGGTSEIRRMLESQFASAFEAGNEPGGDADLIFGGGSYEHTMLKRGVSVNINGETRQEPITQRIDFEDAWLDATYGPNIIGDGILYDPDKHWFGTALSGFGIVYNRDTLAQLSVSEPQQWEDLTHPELAGWIALVNPGQSGSITTAFDTILQRRGWHRGWHILRRAGANARYFSASSSKAPRDVSYGDAAMGVCIDFYGRYQAQAILDAGGGSRVGYVDPPGATTIDADPISLLRNPPNPVVAKRFVEFTLTEEAQALWQFPSRESRETPRLTSDQRGRRGSDAGTDDRGAQSLGPQRFELRRLPILRSMYERHFDRMIDRVNPFEIAAPVDANPSFRAFIAPLFAAMAMDTHDDLEAAWQAIITHPAYPHSGQQRIVTAEDVRDPTLRGMLELFDALPTIEGPEGQVFDLANGSHLEPVRRGWLRREWAAEGLWHEEATPAEEMRKRFVAFFRRNYRQIVGLAQHEAKSRVR